MRSYDTMSPERVMGVLKLTPLNMAHKKLGAKMVDFGGWEMPIQYTSIIEEHLATREKVGIFDVSHMGEIVVKGDKSVLNRLLTCDLYALRPKKIAYSFLLYENGGVVDDLLVYMIDDNEYLLVVNASNTDKDYEWVNDNIGQEVEVINRSSSYGQIAVQGPFAQSVLQELTDVDLNQISFFTFDYAKVCGVEAIVSRTGYTGEDGFEIYIDRSQTEEIWNNLAARGAMPIGLGARDTLRFESALPLYGHELSADITPIEAGLKFFIKLDKAEFLGREVLEKQINEGTDRQLVGIELIDRGIPRDGYRVEKGGKDVGYITSGAYSPTFKKGLAMALLEMGTDCEVDVVIREKRVKAEIVKLPFYNRRKKV